MVKPRGTLLNDFRGTHLLNSQLKSDAHGEPNAGRPRPSAQAILLCHMLGAAADACLARAHMCGRRSQSTNPGASTSFSSPRREIYSWRRTPRQSAWRWTTWGLHVVGWAPKRIRDSVVEALRNPFIARVGILSPGRRTRWYHFDWHVTDAGRARLAANPASRRPAKGAR
jgi:hypothetical protein